MIFITIYFLLFFFFFSYKCIIFYYYHVTDVQTIEPTDFHVTRFFLVEVTGIFSFLQCGEYYDDFSSVYRQEVFLSLSLSLSLCSVFEIALLRRSRIQLRRDESFCATRRRSRFKQRRLMSPMRALFAYAKWCTHVVSTFSGMANHTANNREHAA